MPNPGWPIVVIAICAAAACQSHAAAGADARTSAGSATSGAATDRHGAPRNAAAVSVADAVTTLQSLVPSMAPARTAEAAAGEFTWSGNEPKPAGTLAAVYSTLAREKARTAADTQAAAQQAMSAVPEDMQRLANDPAAQEAFRKKMESMTDAEKMAYAMSMAQRTQDAARSRMLAGRDPTPEEQATLDRISERLKTILVQRGAPDGMTHVLEMLAEAKSLQATADAAHAALDRARDDEIQKVPADRVSAVEECYSEANAQRIRDIELRYLDRHIAQADRDLAAAAPWASSLREVLLPVAREDDALMTDYLAVHDLFEQNMAVGAQYGRNAASVHDVTVNMYFAQFADALKDVDAAAGRWVHDKTVLQAAPVPRCR